MALISRLPSGGANTGIKYSSLVFSKGTIPNLVCSKNHRAVYGSPTLVGTINASCDCLFDNVLITAKHPSAVFNATPQVWYEIREKKDNVLCVFTANGNTSGYGNDTTQTASVILRKGANYLYVCIGSNETNKGSSSITFNFRPLSGDSHFLSTNGETPTLTWTEA